MLAPTRKCNTTRVGCNEQNIHTCIRKRLILRSAHKAQTRIHIPISITLAEWLQRTAPHSCRLISGRFRSSFKQIMDTPLVPTFAHFNQPIHSVVARGGETWYHTKHKRLVWLPSHHGCFLLASSRRAMGNWIELWQTKANQHLYLLCFVLYGRLSWLLPFAF